MYQDIKNHMQQCLLCQQAKMTNMLFLACYKLSSSYPNLGRIGHVIYCWLTSLMALQLFWWLLIDYLNVLTLSHSKLIITASKLKKYAGSTFWNCMAFQNQLYPIETKSLVAIFGNNCSNWVALHFHELSILPPKWWRTEALSWCLEMYLTCFIVDNLREWSKLHPWAKF